MKSIPAALLALFIGAFLFSCKETTTITNVDYDTTIVILDSTVDRFVIDTVVTFASGIDRPGAIIFNGAGDLLVGNFSNPGVINKVTAAGVVSVFGSGPGRAVAGLAIDPAGNVYGGYQDGTVKRLPPSGGTPVTIISNLQNPAGLAFDRGGNLYVVEHDANRISVYGPSPSYTFQRYLGLGVAGPVGITWHDGGLYVANRFGQNIVRIDSTGGTASVVFRGDGPLGTLFIDDAGNLFMTTSGLTPTLKVYVLASNGTAVILAHDFASPGGLAMDAEHRLYVGNSAGTTISRVSFVQ
jgi:sugar lactone lactonase YvrE